LGLYIKFKGGPPRMAIRISRTPNHTLSPRSATSSLLCYSSRVKVEVGKLRVCW